MSDEEAEKVRQANEEIRKQREAHAEEIATKFAQFKRQKFICITINIKTQRISWMKIKICLNY